MLQDPGYSCAWHFFRVLPSFAEAFRATSDFTDHPENEPLGRRGGPMSRNMFCAPPQDGNTNGWGGSSGGVMSIALAQFNLVPYVDGATDVFYPLDDCEEYEESARAANLHEQLIGTKEFFCARSQTEAARAAAEERTRRAEAAAAAKAREATAATATETETASLSATTTEIKAQPAALGSMWRTGWG